MHIYSSYTLERVDYIIKYIYILHTHTHTHAHTHVPVYVCVRVSIYIHASFKGVKGGAEGRRGGLCDDEAVITRRRAGVGIAYTHTHLYIYIPAACLIFV